MASETSVSPGGFIHFSLRMALKAPVLLTSHFDFGECSQLFEFSPKQNAWF